jgi:hypothetical protein
MALGIPPGLLTRAGTAVSSMFSGSGTEADLAEIKSDAKEVRQRLYDLIKPASGSSDQPRRREEIRLTGSPGAGYHASCPRDCRFGLQGGAFPRALAGASLFPIGGTSVTCFFVPSKSDNSKLHPYRNARVRPHRKRGQPRPRSGMSRGIASPGQCARGSGQPGAPGRRR